jgi:heavy metal sensor kinase
MIRQSIRVRLTIWYSALTLVAMTAAGATAWLLVSHSVRQAADDRLAAHTQGLARFVQALETGLTLEEVRDEYREYSEVSLGNALLAVTGPHGEALTRPIDAGWADAAATVGSGDAPPRDVTIGREPYRLSAARIATPAGALHVIVAVPVGPAYVALGRARVAMMWLLPLVCAAAAVVTSLITGRALRPLGQLTRAARSIDVRSLHKRLDVPPSQDEIADLASTFNAMLDRLELGVSNIARFTSEASHELRTPVAIVRTTADLALRRERSPDEYRQALAGIQAESERMSDLVDDLLTMARADAGVDAAPDAVADLGEVAAAFVASWRQSLGERAADVAPFVTPLATPVAAESRHLRRLLSILSENAVKYTPAGGRVEVRVERAETHARLIVDDTGIGVSAEDRPHVFERFFRGAAARAGATHGSGLGLAIAEMIVGRIGGAIVLESPVPGGGTGTRVTVELPLNRFHSQAAHKCGKARERPQRENCL